MIYTSSIGKRVFYPELGFLREWNCPRLIHAISNCFHSLNLKFLEACSQSRPDSSYPVALTPHVYKKGEVKTNTLIPTNKEMLGRGGFGWVYPHRDLPLAVKKSTESMISEFAIGSRLNHPNLLKSRSLFIKEYPSNICKYKMVMDLIRGPDFSHYLFTKTRCFTKETVLSLLEQSKSVSLYILEQKVCWKDIHSSNAYIVEPNDRLLIADFGFWLFKKIDRQCFLLSLKDLVNLILGLSHLSDRKIRSVLQQIENFIKKNGSLRCSECDSAYQLEIFIRRFFDYASKIVDNDTFDENVDISRAVNGEMSREGMIYKVIRTIRYFFMDLLVRWRWHSVETRQDVTV